MLRASQILFLISGGLWCVIGVLTPLLMDKGIGPPMVFLSERTDAVLFGRPPDEMLEEVPELRTLRKITVRSLAGLMLAAGVLTVAIAWFGLGGSRAWAVAALTVVALAILPYWWIALGPYRAAGIRVGLGDVPPFMWVPAILMPVGAVMGWISYLRS